MFTVFGHGKTGKRFLKSIALALSICYLIGPFSQQIYDVLHTIAHTLTPPQQILGHDSNTANSTKFHNAEDHLLSQGYHEHQFIDFVKSFLDDSPINGHETIPVQKIDKHLNTYAYIESIKFESVDRLDPSCLGQNIHKGFTHLWLQPPIAQLF